jgi:hypothetical protein
VRAPNLEVITAYRVNVIRSEFEFSQEREKKKKISFWKEPQEAIIYIINSSGFAFSAKPPMREFAHSSNNLIGLFVDGGFPLTPDFHKDVTEYTLLLSEQEAVVSFWFRAAVGAFVTVGGSSVRPGDFSKPIVSFFIPSHFVCLLETAFSSKSLQNHQRTWLAMK